MDILERTTLLAVDSAELYGYVSSQLLLPAEYELIDVRKLRPGLDAGLSTTNRSTVEL
jgi:hypothetical protein